MILPKEREEQKVNLLIGLDVPETLQPEEIRKGQQGGPFAVRTKFGWTLNGPLQRNETKSKQCYLSNVMCSDDPFNCAMAEHRLKHLKYRGDPLS